MRNKIKYVLFLFVFVYSCGGDARDESILSEQKFTSLLIQMHILEAEFSFSQHLDQSSIEKNYKKYDNLFIKYKTDSTQVSRTFDFYKDKQKELLEIYRNVLDSLNNMALIDSKKTKSK